MQTTPAMDAALSGERPTIFGAFRIDLNDGRVIRLLDGMGALSGGDWSNFSGRDAVFGSIASVDDFSDGLGDEAPNLSFTLTPATDAAAADLASADMQGSRVRFWLGAIDMSTGAVVADPLLLGDYAMDVPTLTIGKGQRSLELECVSEFESYFEGNEGARMNDGYHQSVWPGETGLAHTTGVENKIYWGVDAPPGAVTYGRGIPSGSGRGFADYVAAAF